MLKEGHGYEMKGVVKMAVFAIPTIPNIRTLD